MSAASSSNSSPSIKGKASAIALDQGADDDGLDIPDYLRRTPTSEAAAS
jgi:hypothetical protein